MITFKEYLRSKEVLVEALSNTATTKNRYIMKKYCKLPVLLDQTKLEVGLKPKNLLQVECTWEDYNKPTIHKIFFVTVDEIDVKQEYICYWKNDKMLKWLDSNCVLDSWLTEVEINKDNNKDE